MKYRWIVILLLSFCLSSTWAQDNDQHDALLPDTLNTVWQMKYGSLAKNHAHAITRISPDALCLAGNTFFTSALYGMVPGAIFAIRSRRSCHCWLRTGTYYLAFRRQVDTVNH